MTPSPDSGDGVDGVDVADAADRVGDVDGVAPASRHAVVRADARLDVALVTAGLARSRGHARDLLEGGSVRVAQTPARRASQRVAAGTPLSVEGGEVWVGRAAGKLDAALRHFAPDGLAVAGRCLDVGASTGGFTQVLLEWGVREVVALDVGHGQLVPDIAADPRVTERSGLSIRDVAPGELGEPFDLVVGDLSFISLRLVLPHLAPLLAPGGDVVLLIKPQFEVGRAGLSKHGVVRDPRAAAQALRDVLEAAVDLGWQVRGLVASSVVGSTGNQEYLGWFSTRTDTQAQARGARDIVEVAALVQAVTQAPIPRGRPADGPSPAIQAPLEDVTDPPAERTHR